MSIRKVSAFYNRGVTIAPKNIIFLLLLLLFSFFFSSAAGATDGLRSFLKVAPPLVEPNVLFFLDSSGSMLWPMNAGADEREPNTCTFGDGTLGWQESKHTFLQEYYGRDVVSSDNDPLNPDHYHPKLIWKRGGASKVDVNDELMPNDSRGYKAKLVLWRIFNDADLISGLRIAFGTYMQTFEGHQDVFADWYRYPHKRVPLNRHPDSSPGSVGYDDSINRYRKDDTGSYMDPVPHTRNISGYFNSWRVASGVLIDKNEASKRALLRSDFRIYARDGVVLEQALLDNKLLKWINGSEYYGKAYLSASTYHLGEPEIRFDGWRPLKEALAKADKHQNLSDTAYEGVREGDFIDFFKMTDPKTITDYCQTNWVVLLTSGGQSYGTDDELIQSVKDLYNARVPFPQNKYSQHIKTLVLAFVDPLSTDSNVVALRNKLNRVADAGDNGIEDNSATAYFATDVPSIMSAMNKIIATIRAGSGTNNKPLFSPGAGAEPKETVYYQPLYTARADAHWIGDLRKMTFDGESDKQVWSAAAELQNMKWNPTEINSRKVYLPALSLAPTSLIPDSENLTRLSTSLSTILASLIGIPNQGSWDAVTLTSNFIQWFLGDNIYQEVERFKLFDIYFSGVAKLGPPNPRSRFGNAAYAAFASTYKDRPTVLYAQSNAGSLHAFNDEDGTERWAFIPPNALVKGRLRGLKGNWNGDIWQYDTTAKSYSRYITDGPIVPADVKLDGEYHSVLLNLLGLGGAGMYAVDVTNADAPRFLWAVENDIYIDNAKNLLTIKEEDIKKFEDRKVCYWGEEKTNSDLVKKTELLHSIVTSSDLDYSNLRFTWSVPRIGSVILSDDFGSTFREPVFIMGNGTPYGEPSFKKGEVYVSRIRSGEIIRKFTAPEGVNAGFFVSPISAVFEDSDKRIKTFFAADSMSGTVFMGDLSSTDSSHWTFKDVYTVKSLPGVGSGNIGFAYSILIEKLFGDYWLFAGTGDWLNLQGGSASTTNYFFAVNLKDLKEKPGTLSKLDPSKPLEIAPNNNGWYIEFGKNERLSAPPTFKNGFVFFATFTKGSDPCNPNAGTGRLYGVDAISGEGVIDDNGKKVLLLPDTIITGLMVTADYITYGMASSSASSTASPIGREKTSQKVKDSVSDGSIPAGESIEGLPGPVPGSKEMLPFFWKER